MLLLCLYGWLFAATEVFSGGELGASPLTRFDLQVLLVGNPVESIAGWYAGDIDHFGIRWRLGVLLLGGLLLGSARCLGQQLLARSEDVCGLTRLEQVVFSTTLGMGVFSLFTLAVGLAGGLQQRWLFWLAVLAPLVWSAADRFRPHARVRAGATVAPLRGSGPAGLAVWLGVPFVVFILLGAALPPWEFDVCEYHLQVPKEWFQQGRITFLPHNVYGNMPMGAELHALMGMALLPGTDSWWWGALVGKVVMATFVPLTMLTLLAAGRRFASAESGVVSALVFVSTPWVAYVSMAGLVEVVWGCYLTLAVYATLLWSGVGTNRARTAEDRQTDRDCAALGDRRVGPLMLAGAMAGIAASCKYPALLLVVLPLAVWVLSSRLRLDWKPCALFLTAAFVFTGPWLAKNWLLARNPVYPLLGTVWEGRDRSVDSDSRWRKAHATGARSIDELGRAASRLLWKSRWQSPLLIPLVAVGLFAVPGRRWALWLLTFAALYLACWWLFTHRIDRFWVPLLPILAWLAGLSATWAQRPVWMWTVRVAVGGGLLWTLPWVTSGLIGDHRVLTSLEKLRSGQIPPLSGRSPSWRAFEYLGDHLSPGSRVLLVGEARVFQARFPVLYNTCFDDCRLEQLWAHKSRSERIVAIRDARITHILVHWGELQRYRSLGNYGYSGFVTRSRVHEAWVREQGLLRPLSTGLPTQIIELFQVQLE